MKCNKCGSPLPNEGVTCKFCGAMMDQEQINYFHKNRNKEEQKIMLLSEKYGRENKIEYREEKENKLLGLVVIVIILVILIILTILINIK